MAAAVDWLSEHPWVDLLVAGAVAGLHRGVVVWWPKADVVGLLGADDRVPLYVTGATIIAIVGGLCSVGVSILLANQGPRSLALRRTSSVALRRNWSGLIIVTVGAAGLCMVAQGLEAAPSQAWAAWARWVYEFAVILTTVTVFRLVWLVNSLMAIGDADLLDESRPPAPSVGPRWRAPTPGPSGDTGPGPHKMAG